jgi:hypothetical protein
MFDEFGLKSIAEINVTAATIRQMTERILPVMIKPFFI